MCLTERKILFMMVTYGSLHERQENTDPGRCPCVSGRDLGNRICYFGVGPRQAYIGVGPRHAIDYNVFNTLKRSQISLKSTSWAQRYDVQGIRGARNTRAPFVSVVYLYLPEIPSAPFLRSTYSRESTAMLCGHTGLHP